MTSSRCCRWAVPLILTLALSPAALAQQGQEQPPVPAPVKTWSLSAGLGSTKAWNLVAITKEVFVGDRASVFVTAGLGEMILGAGVAFYGNPGGSGAVLSAVAGTGLQAALTYRWQLSSSDYLVLGASYIRVFGFSDVDRPGVLPVLAYEHRF